MYTFFDAHADTANKIFEHNRKLFENDGHIDLKRILKFETPIQIFAIWLMEKYLNNPFEKTNEIIDNFLKEIEGNAKYISLAKNSNDILKNKSENRASAILSIEGGEALDGKTENLDYFYNRGVRLITLTWNNRNEIGDGVCVENGHGLTPFGCETVKYMQKKGIIVDVSHINEKGFWDVAEIMEKPFTASHSDAKAICSAKRNLSDEQIKRIAEGGGVIGINIYPPFVDTTEKCTIADILNHIEHMLNLSGENSIGIGCDFDGIDKTPDDMQDVTGINGLLTAVEKEFGKVIEEKIAYKNFYRLFGEICD